MAEADAGAPVGGATEDYHADDAAALAAGAAGAAAAGSAAAPADPTEAILRLTAAAQGLDTGKTKIASLQEQRKALNDQKNTITRTIKNEARKRKRLLDRSAKLSVPDLVQTLYIRQQRAAAAAARRAEASAAAAQEG